MADQPFLTEQQEQTVIDAIAEAENQTSAELRIHLDERCKGDPLKRAAKVFQKLGMNQTKLQNGVVIYVAVEDRKAAVFGGKGIHEQVDEDYWQDVLDIILTRFKKGEFEEGLVKAVDKVSKKLTEFFPIQAGDVNELSDDISYDEE